jgi:cytochrome c556
MHRSLRLVLLAVIAASVAACSKPAPTPAPAAVAPPPPIPHPVATVLDLMSGHVAPAAEVLWNAVGTTSGPKGPVETAPHTDADWAALKKQALLIAEVANLLAVEGRLVARPDQKYTNPPGPGDLNPQAAEATIAGNRQTWLAYALVLQGSALEIIKAIDAKNVDAYSEAGGAMDEACETCHKKFWYPDAPKTAP